MKISIFSPQAERAIRQATDILEAANVTMVGTVAELTPEGLAVNVVVMVSDERQAPKIVGHCMATLLQHVRKLGEKFREAGRL